MLVCLLRVATWVSLGQTHSDGGCTLLMFGCLVDEVVHARVFDVMMNKAKASAVGAG